jgi:hypothetical protein
LKWNNGKKRARSETSETVRRRRSQSPRPRGFSDKVFILYITFGGLESEDTGWLVKCAVMGVSTTLCYVERAQSVDAPVRAQKKPHLPIFDPVDIFLPVFPPLSKRVMRLPAIRTKNKAAVCQTKLRQCHA